MNNACVLTPDAFAIDAQEWAKRIEAFISQTFEASCQTTCLGFPVYPAFLDLGCIA